jgi:hypothetical protein
MVRRDARATRGDCAFWYGMHGAAGESAAVTIINNKLRRARYSTSLQLSELWSPPRFFSLCSLNPINHTPKMLSTTILAVSLLPVSFAHFTLNWPKARGSGEDTAGDFPCGGYNDVQQQRTDFPISGGPLQLNMGHEQTNVAVYMAVGSNPGTGFSVVMRPQFQVTGLGNFCIGQIGVPNGVNVTDGTPASIQVVSNAHTAGGLYQVCLTNPTRLDFLRTLIPIYAGNQTGLTVTQCTDVTLRSAALSQSDYSQNCKNATNIEISQQNISGNPNGTSSDGHSPSASGSAAASSPTPGAASHVKAASWAVGAVGAVGLALL